MQIIDNNLNLSVTAENENLNAENNNMLEISKENFIKNFNKIILEQHDAAAQHNILSSTRRSLITILNDKLLKVLHIRVSVINELNLFKMTFSLFVKVFQISREHY